jgi:hypothetical protein
MDEVSLKWTALNARLPAGWTLDSLRCTSTSLRPEDRSDDWVAVALGPDGQEQRFRASDPLAPVDGLAARLRSSA